MKIQFFLLLFYSLKPRSHVRILIYRKRLIENQYVRKARLQTTAVRGRSPQPSLALPKSLFVSLLGEDPPGPAIREGAYI